MISNKSSALLYALLLHAAFISGLLLSSTGSTNQHATKMISTKRIHAHFASAMQVQRPDKPIKQKLLQIKPKVTPIHPQPKQDHPQTKAIKSIKHKRPLLPLVKNNHLDENSKHATRTTNTVTSGISRNNLSLFKSQIRQQIMFWLEVKKKQRHINHRYLAEVEFVIKPTGAVSELHLLKSTGSHSIDNLIIRGIKSIEPISQAKQYLSQDTNFSIEISV